MQQLRKSRAAHAHWYRLLLGTSISPEYVHTGGRRATRGAENRVHHKVDLPHGERVIDTHDDVAVTRELEVAPVVTLLLAPVPASAVDLDHDAALHEEVDPAHPRYDDLHVHHQAGIPECDAHEGLDP